MSSDLLDLACKLIRCRSVTPEDAGCQKILAERLQSVGFKTEQMDSGPVTNMWAKHGSGSPVFVFVGHTDVVPTGPLKDWRYDPFEGVIADGYLHGRGSSDMKGGVAAFTKAACDFAIAHPDHKGTLALILTSDEEGVATDGTVKVIERLKESGLKIDYCLVGEPSSSTIFGDIVKVGRRGSLSCKMTVHGQQGHIAYPKLASNPIHSALDGLNELAQRKWDDGNEFFDPTSFQISNFESGTGAENVIPAEATVHFNFRFSTNWTEQALKQEVIKTLDSKGFQYTLDWRVCSQPFFSKTGELGKATEKAIFDKLGIKPEKSTTGGTSDGRFVAPLGAEVLEFGTRNDTIHKVNERVSIAELEGLARIYLSVIEQLLG